MSKPSRNIRDSIIRKAKVKAPPKYSHDKSKFRNKLTPLDGVSSPLSNANNPFINGKPVNEAGRKGTPMHEYRLNPTRNETINPFTSNKLTTYIPQEPVQENSNWVNQFGRDGQLKRDRYGKFIGERQKRDRYGKPTLVRGSSIKQCSGISNPMCDNKTGCWYDTSRNECVWDGVNKLW
jgi:hypothetical protein